MAGSTCEPVAVIESIAILEKKASSSSLFIRQVTTYQGLTLCHNVAVRDREMTTSYLVLYEQADDGTISGYAPELQPGVVVSTSRNYEEARAMISEAISLYLEEMRNSGQPIAPSPLRDEVVEVAG